MQMKDRLPRTLPHVDHDPVILEADVARGLGDELEHPFCLAGRKRRHLPEGIDVAFGEHEQVSICLWTDVANSHEPVRTADVVAFTHEAAEEAIVRQRRSPRP